MFVHKVLFLSMIFVDDVSQCHKGDLPGGPGGPHWDLLMLACLISFFIISLRYIFMRVCTCVHVCTCHMLVVTLGGQKKALDSLEVGVTDGCKLCDVCAGN